MKARIKKFQATLNVFLKNDYWRMIYTNAPAGAKESLEVNFYTSLHPGMTGDKLLELCKEINFTDMTKADWEFLLETSGNSPASTFYRQQIEACEK